MAGPRGRPFTHAQRASGAPLRPLCDFAPPRRPPPSNPPHMKLSNLIFGARIVMSCLTTTTGSLAATPASISQAGSAVVGGFVDLAPQTIHIGQRDRAAAALDQSGALERAQVPRDRLAPRADARRDLGM